MPTPFLTAEWRKLIMANYAVAPELLHPYLPAGTELDLWEDRCYVSLVGFLFRRVRLRGLPIPFHTTFPEANLRFYVRQKTAEGWRRGVVFIKEIVPRPAITLVARTVYGEPYQTLPMQYQFRETDQQLEVSYSWRLQRWHSLSVVADPRPTPITEGSEAEFITEHYWGYTRRSPRRTDAYEVVHPRWEQYAVQAVAVEADFGLLYGPSFGFLSEAAPQSVLLAEGSPIAVLGGSRLTADRL
ncbi:YqjF family protein [Cesiribacter andamanensis]|uniref:DUF2071 domain-containing protein n=1 Tax=Cesiribacter andamanensis AMV16 TaxID=1279009 RepID=M7NLF0_9BACT|nr:DUF2071 domain-containing protein [Cesiribacter andamanensis]EMR02615.1 hypothetical protein ADICEAN_02271 [Cesiribacter andamanensis AMV16]